MFYEPARNILFVVYNLHNDNQFNIHVSAWFIKNSKGTEKQKENEEKDINDCSH